MFFLYTICKTSSIETKHPFYLPFSLKTIIMKLIDSVEYSYENIKGEYSNMKKILILILVLVISNGCGITNEKKDTKNDLPTQNEILEQTETFTNEYYVNFSKIKNIVYYLELNPKSVKVLEETKNKLKFCMIVDEKTNTQNESILSPENYVRLLEKEGYQVNILDGTISQTFILEKDSYIISLTKISDIDNWKKEHQNDVGVHNISTENFVCEIGLKN